MMTKRTAIHSTHIAIMPVLAQVAAAIHSQALDGVWITDLDRIISLFELVTSPELP